MAARRRLIDIGANLTDPMFRGIYNGSQKHVDDLQEVLKRAAANGLDKTCCTARWAATRPAARNFEADPRGYLSQLESLVAQGGSKVVAVGEMGLDYDRLEFCGKEMQLRYLELQLGLAQVSGLPLFLHCRRAATDLLALLRRNRTRFSAGVVHSFDGTKEEAAAFLDLGLHIGINGCSLKTKDNLEVAATIPTERLLIETDCPWCEVRPSHAGAKLVKTSFPCKKKERFEPGFMVKGRNEPANLVQIAEILAGVRGVDVDQLTAQIYENSMRLFFPGSPPTLEQAQRLQS
ncbi:hypothetical protein HPB47_005752 [Ixodes persulcatus]|uniref:Uncharacterized protein n=1 Tax=Ixodes persulcatus TaxID=34615 RepID=A0AC60PC21_IXOPE|nr:hypothetical protein HPB47_005752 [Ixodes persulcatus]